MNGASELPPRSGPLPESDPHQPYGCVNPEWRIPNTAGWTPDKCATFAAIPDVVTENLPDWNTERGALLANNRIRFGSAMLRTFNPVRMNGTLRPPWAGTINGSEPNGNPEVCAFYGGALTMDGAGRAFGVFGVRPEPRSTYKNETVAAYVHVLDEQDIEDIPFGTQYARPGRAVLVGSYPTPPVTEMWYHSSIKKCGDPWH